MPARPPRTCQAPGCPATVPGGQGAYCPAHRRMTDDRPSAASRGYGGAWRKDRRAFLARNPICVDPFNRHPNEVRPAVHSDHIMPRAAGGGDGWDNLQALCASCHSYKTMTIDMRKG